MALDKNVLSSTAAPPDNGDAPQATEKPATEAQEILGLSSLFGRGIGGLPVLLALALGLSLATDTFLTGMNLENLGRQVSIYAIIAIGQLLVILTAGIDLSVGSVVGLSGVIAAKTVVETASTGSVLLAVLLALVAGAAVGAVNGVLVAIMKMPPFIVTLGTLGMARGLTLLYTSGRTIQPLPEGFTEIAGGKLLGVANLIWLTAAIVLLVGFTLRRTVWGRYIYAVGSNQESARLTGVPVKAVLLSVYALSGALAALGGVLLASRLGNGVPTAGTGYELQAIAACVIGGASLFGARGTAFGALVGALIVGLLNNGGTLLGVDPFWLQVAIGALILVAVGMDQLQGKRLANRRA
ncbi:ABC transporter permease [Micromonospora echinaurantiaca]|uniref:ABC transporter permease n=1 Tax=Micromonospora echinaurantiaca TaxID=47857 RepID=UPI0037A9C68C